MVLAAAIGKLCLQEKIFTFNNSSAISRSQPLSYASFKVMSALVGSIDPAKARTNGKFSKLGCAIFLPCSAVEKAGKRWIWG